MVVFFLLPLKGAELIRTGGTGRQQEKQVYIAEVLYYAFDPQTSSMRDGGVSPSLDPYFLTYHSPGSWRPADHRNRHLHWFCVSHGGPSCRWEDVKTIKHFLLSQKSWTLSSGGQGKLNRPPDLPSPAAAASVFGLFSANNFCVKKTGL